MKKILFFLATALMSSGFALAASDEYFALMDEGYETDMESKPISYTDIQEAMFDEGKMQALIWRGLDPYNRVAKRVLVSWVIIRKWDIAFFELYQKGAYNDVKKFKEYHSFDPLKFAEINNSSSYIIDRLSELMASQSPEETEAKKKESHGLVLSPSLRDFRDFPPGLGHEHEEIKEIESSGLFNLAPALERVSSLLGGLFK